MIGLDVYELKAAHILGKIVAADGGERIDVIAEALRAVEREALERAAKLLLDREKDLESATGNTYLQRVECNVMARAIQKLGMSGDSTS